MPSIFIKDSLRQAVEGATGGKVTVLYSADGKPGYYCIVPKFRLEDIDASLGSGVHPAFVVQGQEKSELFISQFQASVVGGMALSLPGQDPATSFTYDQARSYCAALGTGFHLMTNAEWAAIALWCHKNGFLPRGNTRFGQSEVARFETGRRVDGGEIGVVSGTARTLTGSGPASWRHDNTPAGIADLVGNVNEWVTGARVVEGEIQIVPDNDAALATTDLSANSSAWKAILPNGSLVAPGTAGTLKYDASEAGTTGDHGSPLLSDTVLNRNGPQGSNAMGAGFTADALQALTAKAGLEVPALLKRLGLFPLAASQGGGSLYVRNYGERMLMRGGAWSDTLSAGLFRVSLAIDRSHPSSYIGFRPAFVL
ncbi:SUMF1/EgtB/PvdO family nonheme iron enzyme [Azotobacter beijerinckii]|uniref:Sulfatase-modifying factor enzyme 1 n=1 Tax=Azotobacter beijerinckii TaxID=170623 RepID=A0A1I0ZY77_9GAMM|nr:SUMF1/EgtB/PvdO family nonheme iron enzyme [Azotobacter beijerinckii]SFB30507.1 Sulfatase-modifying factor enzyme 1 [Azotobacter beijerinckii]